jgi:integration host factor subunit beta
MNKSDLIKVLAEKNGLKEIEAVQIVSMVFDGFTHSLMEGEKVEIRGFASFTVRKYGAYNGRNPKTGGKVYVGAKKMPFFKVGKELKARVNGK